MTGHAARERQALCDTLERVGPAAPTLCDPWSSAELAAHLVIRDSRPDLALAPQDVLVVDEELGEVDDLVHERHTGR